MRQQQVTKCRNDCLRLPVDAVVELDRVSEVEGIALAQTFVAHPGVFLALYNTKSQRGRDA